MKILKRSTKIPAVINKFLNHLLREKNAIHICSYRESKIEIQIDGTEVKDRIDIKFKPHEIETTKYELFDINAPMNICKKFRFDTNTQKLYCDYKYKSKSWVNGFAKIKNNKFSVEVEYEIVNSFTGLLANID